MVDPTRDPETGTPRWVKILGIIALGLLVLFVVLHLSGHGFSHLHSMHSWP